MDSTQFDNITILYNVNDVNVKFMKQKNVLSTIYDVIQSIIGLILMVVLFVFAARYNIPITIGLLCIFIIVFAYLMIAVAIKEKFLFGNVSSTYDFNVWCKSLVRAEASFFKNDIIIKVKPRYSLESNHIMTLHQFLARIENTIEIRDISDRINDIHILIDTTNPDLTIVLIKNINNDLNDKTM